MTASGTDVRIVPLDDTWADAYRAFCRETADLTIYGTWEFRNFLVDLLGCQASYLGATDESGRLLGVLPLMEFDGPYGKVLNSLPFYGSYGGVIGGDASIRRPLFARYNALAVDEGIAAATVIENPLTEAPIDVVHDCTDARIGQVTRLDFGDEPSPALLQRIDPSARRNYKKALASGFEVAIDNDAFDELRSIHVENMTAISGRSKPSRFFELLPRHLAAGDDYDLYVARRRGAVDSALLVLYAGRVADYYMPATRLDARSDQPSALILHRAMVDAYDRGCALWNWGGTWLSQEGVLRFKRKWGAEDRPYTYYTKINNPAVLDADRRDLLTGYDHFYVLPFDRLKGSERKRVGQ